MLREGSCQIKETFEQLLTGKSIVTQMDEQIVYHQLDLDENAVWSLLLASGYLKIIMVMFRNMVHGWFASTASNYNEFLKALLQDDIKAMNVYMNRTALATFSFFDSGKKPSEASEPERFYHGFENLRRHCAGRVKTD